MIDYNWLALLRKAKDTNELYATAYGSLNSMIVHCKDGALDVAELDVQRKMLNRDVEVRFSELVAEAREATQRWLNRSLEQLYTTVSTPKAAIYEDGAALGDEEIPE